MQRFVDVFDAQKLDRSFATAALNEKAGSVGWSVLHPGDSIRLEDNTHSVVISGLTWSQPDLEVLDELAARELGDTRVWFFNLDVVFPDERILPGAPRVIYTPVLAEYSGNELVVFGQGGGVMARIRNRFPALRTNS